MEEQEEDLLKAAICVRKLTLADSSNCGIADYGSGQYETAIGDGVCTGNLNNEECGFDGGDCCLQASNCKDCYGEQCHCHDTGLANCPSSLNILCFFKNHNDCISSYSVSDVCSFLANGFCNEENNNLACNYDGGDCCLVGHSCGFCSGAGCLCHETGLSSCSGNAKFKTKWTCM